MTQSIHHASPRLMLASGRDFPLSGDPVPLDIRDVAHQLAKLCRFAGACRGFYSVAQHSVVVSELAERRFGADAALAALLHDAHEMVINDIPSPVKWMLGQRYGRQFSDMLKEFSADIDARILSGLGLRGDLLSKHHEAISQCDMLALALEARDLMPTPVHPWPLPPVPEGKIMALGWSASEYLFLTRWNKIRSRVTPYRVQRNHAA